MCQKKEVEVNFFKRSAAVKRSLWYEAYLYAKVATTALTKHKQYMKLKSRAMLFIYNLRGSKLHWRFDLLSELDTALLDFINFDLLMRAVVGLNEMTGSGKFDQSQHADLLALWRERTRMLSQSNVTSAIVATVLPMFEVLVLRYR